MEDKIKKKDQEQSSPSICWALRIHITNQKDKTWSFSRSCKNHYTSFLYQIISFYHISQTRIFRLRHKWDLSNCRICCCVLWMAGGHSSEASSYILSLFQNLRNSRFWNHNWASRWSRIGGVLELFS